MIRFLIFSLIFSNLAWGAPEGLIKKLRGKVTYNGKTLKKGDKVTGKGTLVTAKSSFVNVAVAAWSNVIVIGPNSSMELNLDDEKTKVFYTLTKGVCRWKTELLKAGAAKKGAVHTPIASFGVRGTNFLVRSNTLLGESEIVVFDGEVEFKNRKDSSDQMLLKKGQWGGLGGRFGNKIGDILDLPSNVLNAFDKSLP